MIDAQTDPGAAHSRQRRASPLIDKDVARELMRRSIGFRHGRLAVVRLCFAVHCEADVDEEHWQYCHRVLDRERDEQLRELLEEAIRYEKARSASCR